MSPRPRQDIPAPFSARRRRQRRRARSGRRRRLILLFILVPLGGLILLAGALTGAAALGSGCDLSSLRPVAIGANSFVYAADGTLLGSIPAERNRQPVPLSAMSRWVTRATIAIEDRRFYEHGGIDPEGIVRALWADLRAGQVVQGGSTITQQLVRNLYISRERTFERKVKEACLALKLNRRWSKDRILAEYINLVYYGNHAYGIEAAAQTYFSKPSAELDIAEAALLAGLPQAPSDFDPFKRPAEAIGRRDEVLQAMRDTRAITRAQYEKAVAQRRLGLKAGKLYTRIREPYFFSYVREELIAKYGSNTVRGGGLKIYTTVVPKFQRAARRAITDTLYLKTDPASALVAIDPRNGAIRAMTAVTPGRKGNQFNLAAQGRRQTGSTFKTFVLTAAVSQGMDPDSTSYISAPFRYTPDSRYTSCEYEIVWCVATYSHSYLGSTSVTRATLSSDNTVYAQMTLDAGPEKVAETARKLGIRSSLLPALPSLGLGSADISPLEMASAYATLAAGGVYSRPMAIRKVVLASGREDVDAGWGKVQRERVIPDWVAAEVTQVLRYNMTGGTGTNAYYRFPYTSAGKTGTTEDNADAWFCAYTPNLSTAIWVGYPARKVPLLNVHGITVVGGTFPAEIWGRFMAAAFPKGLDLEFPVPKETPQFVVWEKGEHALKFDPTSTETETETTETKTKPEKTEAEPTAPAATGPPPTVTPTEPVPTEPPPPTTEPPPTEPPPPTTEPPPPPTEPPPPGTTTEP